MVFEASRLRGRAAFKLTVTTACSWPELSVRGSARKPMPAVEVAYSD